MSKPILTVHTPHGVFSRATNSKYTHVVVGLAVSRVVGFDDNDQPIVATWDNAEQFCQWIAGSKSKSGVFGRFFKDRGYVLSYHGSEAAARKAADKGNSPYVTTRTLGVYAI